MLRILYCCQVYGGHGYIKSNKQEQVLRDVRIAAVWEGTTGIQGLDLLGRKIMLQKFRPVSTKGALPFCNASSVHMRWFIYIEQA